MLYAFVIGRSTDETVDIIYDSGITGSGIAADSNVVTWLASSSLSIRRIGSLLVDGSSLVKPFRAIGRWMYANEPLQILSAGSVGTSNVALAPRTPDEPCLVKLYCEWTPTAAGDKLSIRNSNTKGNPTWATEVKSRATGSIVQSFELEMFMENDQDLQAITDNASASTLNVWQVAYYDSRLDTFMTL